MVKLTLLPSNGNNQIIHKLNSGKFSKHSKNVFNCVNFVSYENVTRFGVKFDNYDLGNI